jgi:hypothetical protein
MYKDSVTIEKDDLVRDILQKALQHVGDTLNGEDSKCQIIESLVELETEGRITASPQEQREYMELLVEELVNNAIKIIRSCNVLKNNKMYPMEEIIVDENMAKPQTIVGRKTKMREAKYESWVCCLRSKKGIDGGQPVRLFPKA